MLTTLQDESIASEPLTQPDETEEEESHVQPLGGEKGGDVADNNLTGVNNSDDDDSEEEEGLSLLERVERNKVRNAAVLKRLGLQHGFDPNPESKKVSNKVAPDKTTTEEKTSPVKQRGMLLTMKPQNEFDSLSAIHKRFPCRNEVVRRILSSFEAFAATECCLAPVFVTGPGGSGKTAVTRACAGYTQHHHPNLAVAYVDCAVIDESDSVDEIAMHALAQIEAQQCCSYVRRSRASAKAPHLKTETASLGTAQMPSRKRGRSGGVETVTDHPSVKLLSSSDSTSVTNVWNFGVSLKALDKPTLLILDNADVMLHFRTKQREITPDFLPQFLVVGNVLNLKLLVVTVSRFSFPWHVRTDYLSASRKSGFMVPTQVHFAGYKSHDIKQVRCDEKIPSWF